MFLSKPCCRGGTAACGSRRLRPCRPARPPPLPPHPEALRPLRPPSSPHPALPTPSVSPETQVSSHIPLVPAFLPSQTGMPGAPLATTSPPTHEPASSDLGGRWRLLATGARASGSAWPAGGGLTCRRTFCSSLLDHMSDRSSRAASAALGEVLRRQEVHVLWVHALGGLWGDSRSGPPPSHPQLRVSETQGTHPEEHRTGAALGIRLVTPPRAPASWRCP